MKEFNLNGEEFKDTLRALKDARNKETNLCILAGVRADKRKYSKNAKKLQDTHKWQADKFNSIIQKLVNQL